MSSLFKAGKKLVDEFKPMLVSQDRNNAQNQSQNYGSHPQPYGGNFTPTTNLSPIFQQPGYQTNSHSNPYAQISQYQSPSLQPQNPVGGYYNPQGQPQPQMYTQYQQAQSSQSLPTAFQPPQQFQQVSPLQTTQQQQHYQPVLAQPYPLTGQVYPHSQALPTPPNHYAHSNTPQTPAVSSPAPLQQHYDGQYAQTNASSFSAVTPQSPPQQDRPTPGEGTQVAPGPHRALSAVELMNQQARYNTSSTPVSTVQLYSPSPQVNQSGSMTQPSQISPSEQTAPEPVTPGNFSNALSITGAVEPLAQPQATYSIQPQLQQSITPSPQPINGGQFYPPPPASPMPAASYVSQQQHLGPDRTVPSPPSHPQTYQPPPSVQPQQPQQYQQHAQYQQYNPMAAKQQSIMQYNQQYQNSLSPPPATMPLQLARIDDQQLMNLQQDFRALTVSPALSASFKEVPGMRSTPTPPKKTSKNGPAPSILRVQSDGQTNAVRKILCLDGGGVRGLASLMILKHLMQRLESQRGGRLEPWQEFDMIAGTSTGGLIAVMLGRLRMSVEQCIEAYKSLSKRIFTPVNAKANIAGRAMTRLKAEGKFESEPLEKVVKEMCREYGLSDIELLKDESADAPKVFLCAAQGINSDAVVIRSYVSGSGEWDDLYDICKIWEAARATSAASTFFDPIQIGDQKYVDGALRYNNPIEKADQESRDLWPNEDRLMISIGTGSAPGPNVLAGNIAELGKTLVKIVTDSEEENARFRRRNKDMVENNLLFRFNVLQGLADVRLDEWDAIGEIMAHTGSYLRSPDTARNFSTCANMMKESGQRLGYIAGEELHVYQKIQEMSSVYCEFCEDCNKGIPFLEKMFLCVDCQLFTCEGCHDAHERSHLRNMIRFNIIQWMAKLPGIAPSAPCRYCAKDAKVRWQCERCDMALCRTCVGHHDRRIEFFSEHRKLDPDSRAFMAIYPPYWSTTPSWIIPNCRCLDNGKVGCSHCDRCHRVVSCGQRFYFCRSCRVEFGSSQDICQECFEEDEEHRNRHQFGTAEIAYAETGPDNVNDAIKSLWACSECPEKFPEGTHHMHPHLHLRLIITPLIAELFRRNSYQKCYSKDIQQASKQYPNALPFQCGLCTKKLAFDHNGAICLREGCDDTFCSDCTLAKRTGHRHYLYEFTIMRSPMVYTSQITCNYCSQPSFLAVCQGLWCSDCKNHFICLTCMIKTTKTGMPKIEAGLPHMKILKPCKVKTGWQFYLMESLSTD